MTELNRDSTDDSGSLQGIWYFLVTFFSFGLLAWIPFVHGAVALASVRRAAQAAVYGALSAIALVLLTIAPVDTDGNPIGAGAIEVDIGLCLLVAVMGVGCVQQARMGRQVYGRRRRAVTTGDRTSPRHARRPGDAASSAIAAVLDARAKRAKAREIVAADPLMAHDLRIGRPDLPRTYDDGGLIDLNTAPAQVIATGCEVDLAIAEAIVEARTAGGGFVSVDDVFSLVDGIPLAAWRIIRDRGVVSEP